MDLFHIVLTDRTREYVTALRESLNARASIQSDFYNFNFFQEQSMENAMGQHNGKEARFHWESTRGSAVPAGEAEKQPGLSEDLKSGLTPNPLPEQATSGEPVTPKAKQQATENTEAASAFSADSSCNGSGTSQTEDEPGLEKKKVKTKNKRTSSNQAHELSTKAPRSPPPKKSKED